MKKTENSFVFLYFLLCIKFCTEAAENLPEGGSENYLFGFHPYEFQHRIAVPAHDFSINWNLKCMLHFWKMSFSSRRGSWKCE